MPNQSGPVFGSSSTFREAYPEVESATASFEEWPTDYMNADPHRVARINGDFVPCTNHLCAGGWGSGLDVSDEVREMVANRETQRAIGSKTCRGMERGKHPRDCMRHFRDVVIKIRYRD